MLPRELAGLMGPTRVRPITWAVGSTQVTIPENEDRWLIGFVASNAPITVNIGSVPGSGQATFQVAANTFQSFSLPLHGTMPQLMWGVSGTAPNTALIVEGFIRVQERQFKVKGPVEWYREQLEKRKRERLRKIIEEVSFPECAALLLDTPIQFAIKEEFKRSAVGGGGGEGSEPLAGASPDLVGD